MKIFKNENLKSDYFIILLINSKSNNYSSKLEDTRPMHTTNILLQMKDNNIILYCKGSSFLHLTITVIIVIR